MYYLEGELVESDRILNSFRFELASMDQEILITALVNICYELNIDVPIWTHVQDRELSKKGVVEIPLDDQRILRIKLFTPEHLKA